MFQACTACWPVETGDSHSPLAAGFFLAAPDFSSGTFRVSCRAGDNTLQPPDWSRVLKVCMWCCLVHVHLL